MRTSLLTRVSFAFCLVVVAAAALLWAHIAMQQRIMARYDATQATDISSLRDAREAQRVVRDYRNDLLTENPSERARSLRLAAQLAPAQEKIRGHVENIALREPSSETFPERKPHHALLQDQIATANLQLERLPVQSAELLQQLEAPAANESLTQQKLGALLVTLDQLDAQLRQIAATLSTRHQDSSDRLSQDQTRAANLTAALLIFAFFAFLVAVGTIWSALSPIQRLTHAASQVGRGEFEIERIRAGKDEVGQLAEAFFAMTQGLASRDRALLNANQELEAAYQSLLREEQARIHAERLAVVGELSARITHELRNPLSSLGLNVEMILEDPQLAQLDEDTREMLHAMEREIQRLEELSTGYLSLARKPVGVHLPLVFTQLVEVTLAQFRRSAELDQIVVRTSLLPDVVVEGDENELRQVVINLIENARIALEERADSRELLVALTRKQGLLELRVEDNGPGVSPAMAEQIFEPFATDRRDGTGLGLSTSQRIAETHGGSLSYEQSTLGGACFILRLPEAGVEHSTLRRHDELDSP